MSSKPILSILTLISDNSQDEPRSTEGYQAPLAPIHAAHPAPFFAPIQDNVASNCHKLVLKLIIASMLVTAGLIYLFSNELFGDIPQCDMTGDTLTCSF